MAIAYASHSFTTPATAVNDELVITKPTGLAVGDMMIAHLFSKTTSNAWTATGWTLITSSNTADHVAYYKVATSDDTSATNFTFTRTGSELVGGAIIRLTGASTTFYYDADVDNDNTASGSPVTFSGGVTPAANSLLLFLTGSHGTGGATITTSSYAIATSNPTWTELYDGGTTADNDMWVSAAYAIRPEATATGNYTVTLGSVGGFTNGLLIAVAPVLDASATATVVTVTATVQTPTPTVSQAPSVVTLTVTVNTPTGTVPTPDFTNTSKNSATWTNSSKS